MSKTAANIDGILDGKASFLIFQLVLSDRRTFYYKYRKNKDNLHNVSPKGFVR